MTRVARFRETHKDAFRQREGFNLTILPMVIVATAQALREFPRMNASVSGDALVVRKDSTSVWRLTPKRACWSR